ncbi:hypothetical protein [Homoserinimonas hongtaonis]|uniref:hypothetical protein n=1 Tax=Homoserinimonas hongtaonis TaxID=2079791 RepID=UPI000D389CAF|nr:hypothetical protein [Salinibacterium hongtaonis]AWB90118.1 hypothetical protein C2138_11705 [Salinibacterium hongtaonis]
MTHQLPTPHDLGIPGRPHGARSYLRQWWIVLLAVLAGVGIAAYLALSATPSYSARATLSMSVAYAKSATDINQGATYARDAMLSYAELAESSTILAPVVRELGLETSPAALAGRVSATTPPGTSVLHISVSDASADEAADIANAIAAEVSEYAVKNSPVDADLGPLITVSTIQPAVAPASSTGPGLRTFVAAGAILGLLAGVVLAAVRQRYDNRLRGADDVRAVTDAPVMGMLERPASSRAAESVQRTTAVLRHTIESQEIHRILVVAVAHNASTSAVATTLAETLSDAGVAAQSFDGDLSESDDLGDSIAGVTIRTEGLVTRGAVALVSTRSLGDSADALLLAPSVDAALVIVDARRVRAHQLTTALRQLESAGVRILGVVVRRDHPRRSSTSARVPSALGQWANGLRTTTPATPAAPAAPAEPTAGPSPVVSQRNS